jgi:hypothetical protein
VSPSTHLPAQRRVDRLQPVAVQFGAGMIEAGNAALHVTRVRGLSLGLDRQVTQHVDALAWGRVLQRDAGTTNGKNLADSRALLLCHSPPRSAQKDVGQRLELIVLGSLLDIQHGLPRSARLHLVGVADREDRPQIR